MINRLFSKVRMGKDRSFDSLEISYYDALDRLVEIYEKTYPDNSYPLDFVYSREGWEYALSQDYLRFYPILYENNLIGLLMLVVDEDNKSAETLGYIVDPSFRGRGTAVGITNSIEDAVVGLMRKGYGVVYSDIQLEAMPSIISFYLTGGKPLGFFPNKRLIKSKLNLSRMPMYLFASFPSQGMKRYSFCNIKDSLGIESILDKFSEFYNLVVSYWGGKAIKVDSGFKIISGDVDVHFNTKKVDHIIIDRVNEYCCGNNKLKTYIVTKDRSAKIELNLTDDTLLYSLLNKALKDLSNLEYLEVETKNSYEQYVFSQFGFVPFGVKPSFFGRKDSLTMGKVNVPKNEIEVIKKISHDVVLNAEKYVMNKVYLKHKVLSRLAFKHFDPKRISPLTKQSLSIIDYVLDKFL